MKKVLVVEDEDSVFEMYVAVFSRFGWKVVSPVDFTEEDIKKSFEENRDGLAGVISDGNFNGSSIDGTSVVRIVKSIDPNVMVVAISSDTAQGSMGREMLIVGADHFLPKPFKVAELLKIFNLV